jgi:hypothetical protein
MLAANPFGPEFDYEIALRLNGYRVMLLGDTWIHHEHDYGTKETYAFAGNGPDRVRERAAIGRMNSPLRFGLDFFGDICAFEYDLVSMIRPGPKENPRLLAVDARAGQGLLDLKNRLREGGVFASQSRAFTTQAKYYPFLYTVADEVYADRIEHLSEALDGQAFDYAIACAPVNLYADPLRVLGDLAGALAPGGQMAFKLRNTASADALRAMTGGAEQEGRPVCLSPYQATDFLRGRGCTGVAFRLAPRPRDAQAMAAVEALLASVPEESREYLRQSLLTDDFLFCAAKATFT